MNTLDAAAAVVDALNRAKADYMLVGSLSSNLYGVPRNTNDADFVFSSQSVDVTSIASTLTPTFKLDPQLSFESVTGTWRRVLTHLETGFLIEFFELSSDPHDMTRFSRRREIELQGQAVFVPTAEDVLITKLRWSKLAARGKDISDARNILAVQGTHLDMTYVHHWTILHSTSGMLEQLLAEIKPL
jgi:hypothetical protein